MPVIKVEDLKGVHAIAELNPLMTDVQFEALKLSISTHGQLEPIITFRGFIVDGRNRVKALELLGTTTVNTKPLPHKTTKEELMNIAAATETRRHQSKTQLAIKAFILAKTAGITQKDASHQIGASLSNVERVSAISKINPVLITDLQAGNLYILQSGARTDSLAAILKDMKDRQSKSTQKEELDALGIANLTPTEQAHLAQVNGLLNLLKSFNPAVVEDAIAKLNTP